jgi:hypothetical protein
MLARTHLFLEVGEVVRGGFVGFWQVCHFPTKLTHCVFVHPLPLRDLFPWVA